MVLSTNRHWAMEEGEPPCDRHRSWGSDRVTQLVGDTSEAAGPPIVCHLLHTRPHRDDLEQTPSSSLTGIVATLQSPLTRSFRPWSSIWLFLLQGVTRGGQGDLGLIWALPRRGRLPLGWALRFSKWHF